MIKVATTGSLLLSLLVLASTRAAHASDAIELIDVSTDSPISFTQPEDINNFGTVLGQFGVGGGQSRCFLQSQWDSGSTSHSRKR